MTIPERSFPPAPPLLPMELSNVAAEAVGQLGRTEDLRFSPSGRRIAIAGYRKGTCLLLSVEFGHKAGRPLVRLGAPLEIASDEIVEPHGFDFIGEDLLVVANRTGAIALFRLPDTSGQVTLRPERVLRRVNLLHRIRSPGSVAVRALDGGRVELLVCNNYRDRVTAHRFHPGRPLLPAWGRIAISHGMRIPDGIALPASGEVIAVSSHATHEVLIYDATRRLTPKTPAVARLVGMDYPHGLRFAHSGRRLFVADAGRPFVQVYDRPAGGWRGTIEPVGSFVPLSEAMFAAGRTNPEEGGPKGIDLHPAGEVIAVTNEEQPLAFFALADLGLPPEASS